jgi:hypothetical protein
MPGVRLRPAPDRTVPDNALIVVRDISRPFPQPTNGQTLEQVQAVCSQCGVQHFHKTYHLQLRAGSVIVSETIWAKLQAMPDNGGFVLVNYVEAPPAQSITPGKEAELIEKFSVDISPVKKRSRIGSFFLGPDLRTAVAGEGGGE